MPKCGHNFHLSCIDVWLRKQSTCPVCRLPLQESLGTKHVRPVMVTSAQSFDNSEIISNEHSQQWLLTGPDRSVGRTNNQRHLELEQSLPGNHCEPTTSGESETRQ